MMKTLFSNLRITNGFQLMGLHSIWRESGCVYLYNSGRSRAEHGTIWQDQVQNNKDLDLPTQQELLAQFRCDEISAVAMAEFNEQAKSQKRPIEAGKVVEGLGQLMKNWRQDALSQSVC
jgi:hypothetical protein